MRCLDDIQKLGYAISIYDDNLKLEYLYDNNPPIEKVKPILFEIKKNKYEIIELLNNQMPADILSLKKNYNSILDRVNKGEKYLESCAKEEFDKYYNNWMELTNKLNNLIQVYKTITQNTMKDEEILEGFKF